MIESGFKRAGFALGIFLAGLHFVGIGISNNGNANFSNPTWNFIQNVWSIELLLLKIILGCFLVYVFAEVLKLLAANAETKNSKLEVENTLKPAQLNISTQTLKHQSQPSPTTSSVPTASSSPEPLSAEDLKRRALKQITGKEF